MNECSGYTSYKKRRFFLLKNMFNYIVTVYFLVSVHWNAVSSQVVPESPCPYIFRYETDKNGNLYGSLTVPKPADEEKVRLEIKFQVPNKVQGGNGRIDLLPENIGDRYMYYNLYFPPWVNYAPKITSITINNQQICAGPQFDRQIAPSLTTITLWNTRTRVITRTPCQNGGCDEQPIIIDFRPIPPKNNNKVLPNLGNIISTIEKFDDTGPSHPEIVSNTPPSVPKNQNFVPSPWSSITSTKLNSNPFLNNIQTGNNQAIFPIAEQNSGGPETESDITFQQPNTNFNLDPIRGEEQGTVATGPRVGKPFPFEDICGVSTDVNHLIYNGKTVSNRLEFPWLSAIFRNNLGLNFICGGSLVSKKHVITAAHCVKENDKTIAHHLLVILLGRKNLQSWSNDDGALYMEPEGLIIHPDYRKSTADADLAIVTLSTEISFTPYIKPVCLWTEDNSLQYVVNSKGVVVGWGRDENGQVLSVQPKQLTMPIVAQETCLRSNKAFADITSNRSFCAGYRNNSGPCNGDSGGGFMMKIKERWILRGVVSLSLSRSDRICNLEEYVVFTDASKFTNWILGYIT